MSNKYNVIIYNEDKIQYVTGYTNMFNIDKQYLTCRKDLSGELIGVLTSVEFSMAIKDAINTETITLDDTLMKRILKYNKEIEILNLDKEIKEKQKQIEELEEKIEDRKERWKKIQEYVANIYNLNLQEDDENDENDEYYEYQGD